MSPSGKALVSGTSIRGFKSLHPSHEKSSPFGLVFSCHGFGGFETSNAEHKGVSSASLHCARRLSDASYTCNREIAGREKPVAFRKTTSRMNYIHLADLRGR